MKTNNIIVDKSFDFAIRIVKLRKFLVADKNEYVLSKQIIRSGTSIGTMIKEAQHAESNADFIHKLSIALKEANETDYWLLLLHKTDYLNETLFLSLEENLKELIKLLVSIIKTSKLKKKK